MKVTEINPYLVIKRFPSHQETITQLFKNNRNFQTLCADYLRCAKALQFWNSAPLCEAPQRRQEYETLLAELEGEIEQILNEFDDTNEKNGFKGG